MEDDFLVREWIRRLLEPAGFTIVGTAINGCKALEQAEALRPDVILMDIGLPGDSELREAARGAPADRLPQKAPNPASSPSTP